MKRDWDIIREILIKFEEHDPKNGGVQLSGFPGDKAYEYSYKLRNNFDSSYYHDIIISEIDNLYNKISFPVDNVDEDRYHTCYNIMYVLYHSDAEKFLQYCEKIKAVSCVRLALLLQTI